METIASFVESDDLVIDVGCDHAYLPIFLVQKKLCQKVLASDKNKNALAVAKQNIIKMHLEDQIKTYLSDGLKNIPDKDVDTMILAGMGASTILNIIANIDGFSIKKLIIQSNSDLEKLRKSLKKKKFFLQKEKIIYEKNHFYVIGVYTKQYCHLTTREQYFGKYDASHYTYYLSLYNQLLQINKKISWKKNGKEKIKIFWKKQLLKKYL